MYCAARRSRVTTQCRKCHKERRVSNGTQAQKNVGFLDFENTCTLHGLAVIHVVSVDALMCLGVCLQIEHVASLTICNSQPKLLINYLYLPLESKPSSIPFSSVLSPHGSFHHVSVLSLILLRSWEKF